VGSFTDECNDSGSTEDKSVRIDDLQSSGRRQFSRSALLGSAVLLSLGNRAAWGQDQTIGCMSLATLNSFNPDTGMFISAPAGRPERNKDLAAAIHNISDPPDYLGTGLAPDGITTVSSCKDPNSIDSVCLVKGTCP